MSKHKPFSIPNNALITLSGTVGVGKSTITKQLSRRLKFKAAFEKVKGNPYLEDYYSNFKQWSFHLQIYFLAERFKQQKMMHESGYGYVQDRSIYEDVNIFAHMQYEKGNMTKRDYETYRSLFEAMTKTPYFPKPDVLVHLHAPLERVMEQIKKRNRQMEVETPLEFWEELYERYENWINHFKECPVLKINILDYDVVKDPTALNRLVLTISDFLYEQKKRTN